MKSLFIQGIEDFNRQLFFEAHDAWEELWMETRGERRLFYQGLIQTAVGFYHLSNANYKGGCSQLGKGLAKVERYLPSFHGIDTQALVPHHPARLGRCRTTSFGGLLSRCGRNSGGGSADCVERLTS